MRHRAVRAQQKVTVSVKNDRTSHDFEAQVWCSSCIDTDFEFIRQTTKFCLELRRRCSADVAQQNRAAQRGTAKTQLYKKIYGIFCGSGAAQSSVQVQRKVCTCLNAAQQEIKFIGKLIEFFFVLRCSTVQLLHR